MLNQRCLWSINLSVSTILLLGLLPQFPTLAEIPTFDGTDEQFLTPTEEPRPSHIPVESGILNYSYVLGPGDQLQIEVFDYEEFNSSQVILQDGTLVLPLIGKVMAANRTLPELTQELTNLLKEWVTNPVVTINLTKPRPLLVNIAGEVQRPGPLQLSSETIFANDINSGTFIARAPTVSGAILASGGVTRNADIRRVLLKRYSPDGNSPTIVINLWQSLISENVTRDPVLQDGDSIFVPKLIPGDSLDSRLVARSSYAPKTVRVRIVGEVKKPGELEVPPNSSLSSAVAIAGGPTDKAKLSNVRFIRLSDDGSIQEEVVDLSQLNDTYQVQDGDVLIVPKSRTSTALDFAIDLTSPLGFLINLYRALNGI